MANMHREEKTIKAKKIAFLLAELQKSRTFAKRT